MRSTLSAINANAFIMIIHVAQTLYFPDLSTSQSPTLHHDYNHHSSPNLHHLDVHRHDVDLLTGRILRRFVTQGPRQRLVRVPLICRAHVPAVVQLGAVRVGCRDHAVVYVARDSQVVLGIEDDLLVGRAGQEQRYGDVGGRVIGQLHGGGDVEVAADQQVGQDADGADGRVDVFGAGVVEVVDGRRVAGDGGPNTEAFLSGAFVTGDEPGAVDGCVGGGDDEVEGRGLVCELCGDLGGGKDKEARDDRSSHLEGGLGGRLRMENEFVVVMEMIGELGGTEQESQVGQYIILLFISRVVVWTW